MNEFVQRILAELKTNKAVSSEPLVKMLVESTEKSIALGENTDKIYSILKSGLTAISESTKNVNLEVICSQFTTNETTIDSQIAKIANGANLMAKIETIKESEAYSNPMIKTQADAFAAQLNAGTPDFSLCNSFLHTFEKYSYDATITKCMKEVSTYLTENRSTLAVLNTIYQLDMMRTPVYAGVSSDLKNMLVSESYSADIIKLKYANRVPIITNLINDLKLIESQENGTFTLGEGNYETRINDLITPAIKTEDGLLMYTDNRFLSIRESNGLLGNEAKIHVDGSFKIADVDPNHVKEKHPNFYDLCEAFVTLGFTKTSDGLGVESKSIRNFTMALKMNEAKDLDLYINGTMVGAPNAVNISEAIALENHTTKSKVNRIVEGVKDIFNFEFIKEVSNDRLMAEATLVKLNDTYFICEKVNAADRVWNEVNEHEMYEFFKKKFNYDISPIFKTKIDETAAALNKIEERKRDILANISKLEESVKKLDLAINNKDLDSTETKKLETIKESIDVTINKLKEEYIRVDLLKKKELV